MADTLRYLSEVRALIPDNAQQLVAPQDVREYLLALEPDRGGYVLPTSAGPVTLTLPAAGEWVEINSVTLPGLVPIGYPIRWANDTNARPVPAWGGEVTVPAGHTRAAYVTAALSLDPDATNTDDFELGISYGGTIDPDSVERFKVKDTADIVTVTVIAGAPLVQDGSTYVAAAVRNLNGARDVNVYSAFLLVRGYAYETEPV